MKLKAHLFPHTYLPEMMIGKIISLFGPVRIYQPWFMDSKEPFHGAGLETVNPPDNLKPAADIKAMLSGYRQWIDQNRDRGLREFLRASEKAHPGDNSTWEIRQLLKAGTVPPLAGKEETILKWHVLLHLADEVERRNFEIADMMKALKKRGSVLAGALQDPDETKSFLDDMQGLETTGIEDGPDMGLVLNAWFGLFGGYLEKDSALITCSRHAMDYASTQWDEAFSKNDDASPQEISFNIPSLSSSDLHSNNKIEADNQAAMMKLRELIFGFGEDQARSTNGLRALAGELGETQQPSEAVSNISLKYFPASEKITGGEGILKDIMGKTIIYFSPG